MLGPVFQRTTICKSTKCYAQRLVVRSTASLLPRLLLAADAAAGIRINRTYVAEHCQLNVKNYTFVQ